MPEVAYLLDGSSATAIGRAAQALHQTFMGVKECPHRMYPAAWMASRRLFFIEYGNIDDADIEMIRVELARTFNTQAWSVTTNADGVGSFNPPLTQPNEIPPNRNEGLEHDLPPGFGGHSNDSYSDDGDDDGWDSDWDYPPPPPYSREDLYPNERDHVDEYEDDPEPRPYDSRGRGIFADDYDRGDEYDDDLEPPPRHSGRRHTFANDYGHGGGYQEDFEPPPRRSRRRDAFASDYVRGRGYGEDPERPPSRRRRRDMWESDHPHYHVYHDDPGPSLRRNRRRYTYATEYDQDDRYDEYGEPARYRDSTRRAGYDRAELSQHRSRRSVQDSSMDWMYEGSEEGSTPARIYSGSNSRHGRDRNRDDPRRSRVNHPSSRSHLRARPERRKICSLLRSFLNYTTS